MNKSIKLSKIPKVDTNLSEADIKRNLRKKDEFVDEYSKELINQILERPDIKKALKLLYENGD